MKRKFVSTIQLAKICGVSQGTVDRALNNRPGINIKTKEKILQAAKEYGYRPNIHASAMSGKKSQTIGIVIFDVNNDYFSELIMGIEESCKRSNLNVVVMFTHKNKKTEIDCIDNLYHMYVDGIVICPINTGAEFENYLLSLDIPIVTVGNRLKNFPHVGIDDERAAEDIVKTVYDKGYKRLILISPDLDDACNFYAQTKRKNSVIQRCEKLHIECLCCNCESFDEYCHKGTIIVCTTGKYALRIYNKALEENLSVISFDNIRIIDDLMLKISTISCNIKKIGDMAVKIITEGFKKDVVIDYKFVCKD